jgi:hypothetical protein
MLDYGDIRNLYKNIDRVNSTHIVIGEWNMNKYQEIRKYGIYKDPKIVNSGEPLLGLISNNNVLEGKNYFLYDDGTVKLSPESQFFSDLSSIFLPNRPDPGIVLLQHYKNNLITRNSTSMRVDNISPDSPRYYPFSYNRDYDYFNSAKVMAADPDSRGVSNNERFIFCASPFVIYQKEFPMNKITIKVQNHMTVPSQFQVEYLEGEEWKVAFPSASSAASLFSDGILELYLSNNEWSASVNRLSDITELTDENSTNVKTVRGIRFLTYKINRKSYGLEIIELSPRLEIDLTSYTESFSFNSTIGDSANMGLPVGSIVSSNGNLSLSNEEDQFLFSSTLSNLKMLNPDTKFTFYQIVNTESSSAIFPLKVMYSNEWNVGEDYSVSVNIEDGFKYLREKSAPDLMLQYKTGTKLSTAILTVLDNAGITGMEFERSGTGLGNTGEDVSIRNFFCKKEQTVAEVLEQLALATQCSMFYDATGKLKVMTKERLVEKAKIDASSASDSQYNPNPDPTKFVWWRNDWYFYNGNTDALPDEQEKWSYSSTFGFWVHEDYPPPSQNENDAIAKTDFWFIFNEDYTKTASANVAEYAYINDYKSNVISYSEQKINPITDGEVFYHTYGPRKEPGLLTLPEKVLNDLIEDIPATALAFSNYTYKTMPLWKPGDDNSSALGAANLVLNLKSNRLKDVFTEEYTALNEEEAVRFIYSTTNSFEYFDSQSEILTAKQSLIIFIDRGEGRTFSDYEGYILIDNEYIKYKGKLFSINGRLKILFSEEEFLQELRYLPKGGSISIIGLIVDVKLKVISQNSGEYTYKVVGDGRGKFSSDVAEHYALAENSDGININKTFKLTLGETNNYKVPGDIKATTKFNYIDRNTYKSVKENIGSLAFEDLQSYLGFLKLSGPKSPQEDITILEQFDKDGPTQIVTQKLKDMNAQVDAAVDGDFDPYMYMSGERNIYGQYIDLDFVPNSISTRMRLFSSLKKRKANTYIMSTNSSIAGIGFGLNDKNEGYFVEVESVGSGKSSVSEKAVAGNLRMYKVSLNSKSKYEPKLLFTAPVGANTVTNTDVQVIKNVNTADPVFELEIRIKQYENAVKYVVYYGNRKVNSYIEPNGPAFGLNSKRIFMFVRNDSQAIYEYIAAAARPAGKDNDPYFKSANFLDQKIQSGILPVSKDFYFKNEEIKVYFNDFARLVRQVKEYNIRYNLPAFSSALVDISKVNPEYMIKKYSPTTFGARLVVVNTSSGPITLGEESLMPLYIVGIQLEELSFGQINMKDYYDIVEEDKLRVTRREQNLSIYGSQSVSIDSQYIQTMAQAKNMMKWITRYCGRQRLKMSLEIFPNPLIELGDKVRIYDKTRGYTLENENFGDRVFIVSAISHSVNNSGPTMNIEIIEVGK